MSVARPPRAGCDSVVTETSSEPKQQPQSLADELRAFEEFGTKSRCEQLEIEGLCVETYTNEFWTSAQREGHSLHEVSYRACFKPSLPAFFIERLSKPGDLVLDPFMGRGTTALEASLRARVPCGNDVNPLSSMLVRPRLQPPELPAIYERIDALDLWWSGPLDKDLLEFFHPETLRALYAMRAYFLRRDDAGELDAVDDWLRMVCVNRLTGHSSGFFSVYTLPPNQATSPDGQRKINEKRAQVPPERDVWAILKKKSQALLQDVRPLMGNQQQHAKRAVLMTGDAASMPELKDRSVQLVVTSPPFLDVVQYASDNWLRCWFCGIEAKDVPITMARSVKLWQQAMREAFVELHRVVRPGGYVAFEVGEVRKGKVRLEEAVLPVAAQVGFVPELVMINAQNFTKTANCWGVDNNKGGTNTNRIVVMRRP